MENPSIKKEENENPNKNIINTQKNLIDLLSEGNFNFNSNNAKKIENNQKVIFKTEEDDIMNLRNKFKKGNEGYDFVRCPECGKRLKTLYRHMEHIHNMTLEQVREKYPTLNMYSVKNKSKIKEEKIEIEQKPKLVFFKLKRKRMSELRKRFIHSK